MADEITIKNLVATISVRAGGAEAAIEALKSSLKKLDQEQGSSAAAAQKAMQDKVNAYKLAEIEAQRLAVAARQAADTEKKAAQEAADAARLRADQAAIAAGAAQNAYEREAMAARKAAEAAKQSSAEQQISMAALTAVAAKTFQGIVRAVDSGISAYNRYTATLQGLSAIGRSKGIADADLTAAMNRTKDAMLDAASAGKALQNLLAKGFSLEAAEQTIAAIKDSAAVNRAAHLSVAEAVVQTTEGIKNENSTLSDQAGITKNLSVMLKEYAEANGLVAANLTDAQKAEAYRLGVLKEAEPFMGAAAQQMDTLAGAQAKASATANELAVAHGTALAPVVKLGTQAYGAFLGELTKITEASPGFVAALTGGVTAATGLLTVMAAIKALNIGGILAGLSGAPAMIALGVGVVATIATAVADASERAKEAQEAHIKKLGEEKSELTGLAGEYNALADKSTKSIADRERMIEIEQVLAEKYGITASAITDESDRRDYLNGRVAESIALIDTETLSLQKNKAMRSIDMAQKTAPNLINAPKESMTAQINQLRTIFAQYYDLWDEFGEPIKVNEDVMKGPIDALVAALVRAGAITDEQGKQFVDQNIQTAQYISDTLVDAYETAIQDAADYLGMTLPPSLSGLKEGIVEAFKANVSLDPEALKDLSPADALTAVLSQVDISGPAKAFGELMTQIYKGGIAPDEIATITQEANATIRTVTDSVVAAMEGLGYTFEGVEGGTDAFRASMDRAVMSMLGLEPTMVKNASGAYMLGESLAEAQQKSSELAKTAKALGDDSDIKNQIEALRQKTQAIQDVSQSQQEYIAGLQVLQMAEVGNAENSLYLGDMIVKAKREQNERLVADGKRSQEEERDSLQALLDDKTGMYMMYADTRAAIEEKVRNLTTELNNKALADDIENLQRRAEAENLGTLQRIEAYDALIAKYAEDADAVEALEARKTEALERTEQAYADLQARASASASEQAATQDLLDMATAAGNAGQSLQQMEPKLRAWVVANGLAEASLKDIIKALKDKKKGLDDDTRALSTDTEKQLTAWQKLKASLKAGANGKVTLDVGEFQSAEERAVIAMLDAKGIIEPGAHGVVTLDGTQVEAEANALIETLSVLLSQINEGRNTDSGRRGGGGKKKDDAEEAARAAEEARRKQEEEWQKELDAQLRYLERRKRLGEISTQQEIAELERIASVYAKTTDQKIAMEEKLFDAKMRLREEEISQLDRLNQGVIDALRARYEEELRIEQERLKSASEGWREWADERVKAIQAQIDALDELTKYEDREAQEAAKLRKIEATRQSLLYATDEYSQEKLRKELEKLEAEYAKWQRQNAIADEKERLRAEQEAIRERAQAEQDAIAKQQDELSAIYDERLKDAALQAEAERMLTQSSQETILKLISDYAPEYEATGRTLGEKLIDGMSSAWGSVTNWFDSFNAQVEAVQAKLAQTALAAADAYYAANNRAVVSTAPTAAETLTKVIHLEPKYYFNVPVESPSDTMRRVEQTNEELAAML